jgi:TRAP-type mannitol/chloroaromatic compound transport system substrate-binding protein
MGKLPAAPLFGYIPFGMDVLPYLTWFYQGGGAALYQELYKAYDLGFAAPCGMLPSENLAWSNKPIRSLEDFKGLKFRTSGFWGEILSEAGASVMMLPAGEIYEALQRNVLDAGEFSIPSMDKDLAFHEIAKYLLVPGIHQPSTFLDITVNKKSWAKLPEDLKAIVKIAAQATTLEMVTLAIHDDIHALNFFEELADKVAENGGKVFFAKDAAQAVSYCLEVAKEHGVKTVVKGKSMVTEEVGLNQALEAQGIDVWEIFPGQWKKNIGP